MEKSVFTFDSPRIQQFSLPSNITYYLNQNQEYPRGLQKLQKTCKYFFARNKLLIIEDGLFENTRWPKYSIKHEQENLLKCNAKLSFLGKLHLWGLNSTICKNLCSKVFYNNITLLTIYFTTLDLSDYEILTSSKRLKDVDIQYCAILNEDKNGVQLDEIFNFTSNIASFRCIKPKSIIEVPNRNEITNQILENMFANITENSIDNFFISAAASKAVFTFSVCYAFDGQKQQISTALFQMLEEWNIPEQKPQIVLSEG